MQKAKAVAIQIGALFLGESSILGENMKVSIDCEGRIRGLNKVLNAVVELCCEESSFEQAGVICNELGKLVRELTELAWICRRGSRVRSYFGYEAEVYVAEKGITWQSYRTAAAPPPPPSALRIGRHSLVHFTLKTGLSLRCRQGLEHRCRQRALKHLGACRHQTGPRIDGRSTSTSLFIQSLPSFLSSGHLYHATSSRFSMHHPLFTVTGIGRRCDADLRSMARAASGW